MGRTSKRSYRSIVEPTKTCYPKAKTVKQHHYKISQSSLPRLNVEPAKTEKSRQVDAATGVLVGALVFVLVLVISRLFA